MINSNAKISTRKRTRRFAKQTKKTISPKRVKDKESSHLLTETFSDGGSIFETSKEDKTREEEENW